MAVTRDPVGEYLDLPEADSDPTEPGQVAYRAGVFRFCDGAGIYDPRAGSDRAGLLIFSEAGGLIYDSAGAVLIKANE